MADDLQDIRGQVDSDLDAWDEPRRERAKDMKYRAGDPWDQADKDKRDDAGRPYITVDELSQYTNQIVNGMRTNPLNVTFAPGPPITAGLDQIQASEKGASLYSDKWREIEYRSYAHEAYATAFENCVDGSYGYMRLVSDFAPGTFEQELTLKGVPDPNTILPDPGFQRPDLLDMTRCTVFEPMEIETFKDRYPKAKVVDFGSYLKDASYDRWFLGDDKILLAESWRVKQVLQKVLLVQLPAITPPSGTYGFRPPSTPPPMPIPAKFLEQMPEGTRVLKEREDFVPQVIQQTVNGVEILKETTWPGRYIPIAGCLGRILYLDEAGESKRVILSAIRLARDPFMAYCFYRTCEMEAVGQITKNPYWAYEGQVSPEQQQAIAKSIHEPVALLTAKATTPDTGPQILPLPQRNPMVADLQGFSVGAEEMRRAIQAAMGSGFLPTVAQRQNEKSGVALERIRQTANSGNFHFFDHYKAMRRAMAVIGEAALDTMYDTRRQITVRRQNETNEPQWINDPANPEAIDVRGSYTVDVSDGPSVDSTREAASDFADLLLSNQPLLEMLGPQKAQQIAALAIKLKIKQTGIGSIGDEIVDIIVPKPDKALTPEQMQQQIQQLTAQLQQAQQILQQASQEKQVQIVQQQGKFAIAKMQEDAETQRAGADREVKLAVAELGAKVTRMQLFLEERARLGTQIHDMALAAADAAHEKDMATRESLTALAQPHVDAAATPPAMGGTP